MGTEGPGAARWFRGCDLSGVERLLMNDAEVGNRRACSDHSLGPARSFMWAFDLELQELLIL